MAPLFSRPTSWKQREPDVKDFLPWFETKITSVWKMFGADSVFMKCFGRSVSEGGSRFHGDTAFSDVSLLQVQLSH